MINTAPKKNKIELSVDQLIHIEVTAAMFKLF